MVTRRSFIRHAAGMALVPTSIASLVAACTRDWRSPPLPIDGDLEAGEGRGGAGRDAGGYGPLVSVPGSPVALPRGFQVRAFGRVGDPMSDGNLTPIAHDGMAAFAAGPDSNHVRLVRNHEDRNPAGFGPPIGGGGRAYDPLAGGGTTTLVIGPRGQLVADFVSLEGTIVNCAGGPTPWGSWLSCEEAVDGPMEGYARPHGYCFDVPAAADGPVDPRPIPAMGRFRHEAVACDPASGIIYETEDNEYSRVDPTRPGSGFYRFRPNDRNNLWAGGALEMMKIAGLPDLRLFQEREMFAEFDVEWVPIPDPDPADADRIPLAIRNTLIFGQGAERGAAVFRRLEGCWFGGGNVFFHDTRGGPGGRGQVWQYDPLTEKLLLIFISPGTDVLDRPDNITVSPQGNIVICEDGPGTPFLRGLTRTGEIFDLARNELNDTEFAGATFSPDGKVLYVNIQGSTRGPIETAVPGVTLAIWGPWSEGVL